MNKIICIRCFNYCRRDKTVTLKIKTPYGYSMVRYDLAGL